MMAALSTNTNEFDRHSSKYRQFKIRNTHRTSTPQLQTRPKFIRQCANVDNTNSSQMASIKGQDISSFQPKSQLKFFPSSSIPPDVDTAYVSYVQWRHYLVVPNSARNFKVRYTGKNTTSSKPHPHPVYGNESIISGNINMLPYQQNKGIAARSAPTKRFSNLKRQFSFERQAKMAKVEDLLNSRIIDLENGNFAELKENLERRNQRIVDAVVPVIKKSLKRFFVGDSAPSITQATTMTKIGKNLKVLEPKRSRTAKIFSGFAENLRAVRRDRDVSEDRVCLIDMCDHFEIEE